jgi:UDP-N-acetylmuramyl pentapeptide phosphotransferase/UDP-N-acetylglucosamine-1-phosphate transferase
LRCFHTILKLGQCGRDAPDFAFDDKHSDRLGDDRSSSETVALDKMRTSELLLSIVAVVAAGLLSAGITWAIRPFLLLYALTRPNERSSHRIPTPQGAGIAVVTATLLVAGIIAALKDPAQASIPATLLAAALFIAIVGFADDVKSIPVLPRLMLQAIAVGAIVFSAPSDLRIVPTCSLWIERSLLLFAGVWFVNVVNFMDGLDWMTVAEVVPIAGAIIALGWFSEFPGSANLMAAALLGAMLGFAPFNRPVAKVFLGDVGSLPIGLLLGWCLLQLAYSHQFIAALLLPLYYLADATVTLLRRLMRHERFWAAHRSHFYQQATDKGFSVLGIVSEVFLLNVFLAALAIASIAADSIPASIMSLGTGAISVTVVLYRFSRKAE